MVTLVNKEDCFLGVMDKMAAHRKGELHRAFSVFLFNLQGEILLQRRAESKYHSGGLWTNTCCSHPYPGEETEEAAHRRLQEELGMDASLYRLFSFQYKAILANGLIENELDHVLIGVTNENPVLNPEEADDYRYERPERIRRDLKLRPQDFTVWFQIIFEQYGERITNAFQSLCV